MRKRMEDWLERKSGESERKKIKERGKRKKNKARKGR
jgi:hypothetical protein